MIEQKNQNNIQQSPTRVQRWNYMHVKLIKCSYSSESIISSNNSFEYNTLFSLRWKEYISRVLYVWWKTCQKMIIDDWNMSLLRVSRDTYAFFFLKNVLCSSHNQRVAYRDILPHYFLKNSVFFFNFGWRCKFL